MAPDRLSALSAWRSWAVPVLIAASLSGCTGGGPWAATAVLIFDAAILAAVRSVVLLVVSEEHLPIIRARIITPAIPAIRMQPVLSGCLTGAGLTGGTGLL